MAVPTFYQRAFGQHTDHSHYMSTVRQSRANECKRSENNLIGQIVEMDNVAHHPDWLVEWAKFVISVTTMRQKNLGKINIDRLNYSLPNKNRQSSRYTQKEAQLWRTLTSFKKKKWRTLTIINSMMSILEFQASKAS